MNLAFQAEICVAILWQNHLPLNSEKKSTVPHEFEGGLVNFRKI